MSAPSPRISIDTSSPSSPRSASAFPFPAQDSAHRPTSSSRYQPRRGSAASIASIGSIGGTLDTKARRGSSVRETSHNAISTLLQPPIVRTGLLPHTQASASAAGFKPPTTKDIPPVTLSNIPHVPPENFRDYLTRIGPLFESFQRGRSEADQATWLKKDKELEKTDRFADALDKSFNREGPASPMLSRQNSFALLSPADTPNASPRRRSSAANRRNRNEPTPLSTIPPVYFDEDFHLENPRTFDVVSERAEIVRPPPGTPVVEQKAANGTLLPPRKSLATNAILQEKLSWYMDTVEVHLINNISTASSGFFTALGSLKELQIEAEESVAKIQGLREDLKRLDKEVAVGGLEVASKRRRKENVRKLAQATAQVQEVVGSVKRTDDLVDEGNFDEAADQMDKAGRLICGQQEPGADRADLIDLRPLKALQGLDSGMQELQYRIGTGFAQRFTTALLSDLRQHVGKVPPSDTLKRWSRQRGIAPIYMEASDELRKDLLASLNGLARCGHTAPAIAGFREAATKEMKALIRKHLPSSTDDDADSMVSTSTRGGKQLSQQDKSSILARNLRALEHEDAEKMLVDMYTSVGEALRRLSTQTKVLLDVTSQMQSPPESRNSIEGTRSPPRSPNIGSRSPNMASINKKLANGSLAVPPRINVQDDISQALDMSSLLGLAVDTAQTQITRVLKVRNDQSTRLSKSQFLRYFTLNRLFADECEAVSGRGGLALRGVINAQITGFVQALGQAETSRISDKLDADNWNAVDVSEHDQAQLDKLIAAMDRDPPEWASDTPPIWEPSNQAEHKTNGEALTNGAAAAAAALIDKPSTPGPTSKTATKPALIDQNRYILVASAIALLPTLNTFLSLTASLPSLTPQISASLLEVLRAFNSRSSQLILGAGATRIAGLKNITTKHLALSSQALSFVIALIPYLRECVRRHLPANQTSVLADFDKTKRLCQEHQSGIHDKLVEIMTARSNAHVKSMLALDFDSVSSSPSPYMETLTKETLTLHRVLSRHLTEGEVSMIARRIFAEYKTQWTKAFGEAEVRTEKGEKALLRDAETLKAKLGKIEEFGGVGDEVLAVVKAKIGFVDEKADEESKSEAGKKEGEGVVEKGSGDGNGTATPAVEENSKSNGADAKV
jgi:vacuolar protein sorting-associated protein 54